MLCEAKHAGRSQRTGMLEADLGGDIMMNRPEHFGIGCQSRCQH